MATAIHIDKPFTFARPLACAAVVPFVAIAAVLARCVNIMKPSFNSANDESVLS